MENSPSTSTPTTPANGPPLCHNSYHAERGMMVNLSYRQR
jgi:hypothetical protein